MKTEQTLTISGGVIYKPDCENIPNTKWKSSVPLLPFLKKPAKPNFFQGGSVVFNQDFEEPFLGTDDTIHSYSTYYGWDKDFCSDLRK